MTTPRHNHRTAPNSQASHLYGVDLLISGGNRAALTEAFRPLRPLIPHLFFQAEEFDRYLKLLAEENLALAVPLCPQSDSCWKLELEMLQPVPTEEIAIRLSRSSLLVARPKDKAAQYSPYLIYTNGTLTCESELEDDNGACRLKTLCRR